MSGMEVAGLILGAVPIMVAALGHYKTNHKKSWSFRYKASRIDQLIIALENQKFFLEGDLELALLEAGFERYDIVSMDTSNLQGLLCRSDVAEELSRSLGRGFGPYKDTLGRCEASLTKIVQEMKGLVPGPQSGSLKELLKANSLSANGKYEFRSRIKFVLKDDELKQRVNDLRETTDTLTKLRHLGTSLNHHEILSEQRIVGKFAVFLQRVQRHADVLYSAMSQRLISGCHHEHETRLYLENRSDAWHKRRVSIHFDLILGSPAVLAGSNMLSQELQVAVLDNEIYELTTPQARKQPQVMFDLPQPSESREPLMDETICFWRLRPSPNADEAAFLVDTSHPFLVHKFNVAAAACPTHKSSARQQLLNLGIVLLEIGHEKSFESWASAHGFTLDTAYGSRYDAASAWLRDSAGDLLCSYYDAAARCIECTFQTRPKYPVPDWEDSDFRKSICELVIKPLWSICSGKAM
ncbi:hypothetical protein HO133_003449 [Letharia lupina]|uniref:Uncharacterized protein n=1 Tax=Letharia lupina TaxID=560253 RepID=A0A8H6CBC7_9LECA|nr:uncharacterized protein HO133_003449 [Letharia lupina]KAF6220317.1 hypothetical protein HO133_003449 [Letharia lupina]